MENRSIRRINVYSVNATPYILGRNGDVYVGYLTKGLEAGSSQPLQVAIKTVRRRVGDATQRSEGTEQEIACWSRLSHPNIVMLVGICNPATLPEHISRDTPALVFVYPSLGSVDQYLKGRDVHKTRGLRLKLLTHLLAAVEHMHGKNVVHGNIKSKKILVDVDGIAYLSGFDSARIVDHPGHARKPFEYTTRWAAPELLECLGTPVPTAASDIWAVGMTAIEILTGRLPYSHHLLSPQVVTAISSGERPNHSEYPEIPLSIWEAVKTCWVDAPTARTSASHLLAQLEPLL